MSIDTKVGISSGQLLCSDKKQIIEEIIKLLDDLELTWMSNDLHLDIKPDFNRIILNYKYK